MLSAIEKIREAVEESFGFYLPDGEWEFASQFFSFSQVSKKQVLVKIGESAHIVLYVYAGLLKGSHIDSHGNSTTKLLAAENEFITPYADILRNQPSEIEIAAVEDSQVLQFEHSALVSLYSRHPSWIHIGRLIAEKILLEKVDREMQLLTESPTERYQNFCKSRKDLAERLPKYEIASYIGISPVALSNIRARLRSQR